MPSYDYKCRACENEFEVICQIAKRNEQVCEKCGGEVERLYKANGVISDECDITAENVLPGRRFTSKSEMKRVMQQMGYENYVKHQPKKGSDKSDFTTRWY